MAKIIHAVAGVLLENHKVLMASRPVGKVHAGSWEFPGGKIEANETNIEALIRELREEIGVIVNSDACEMITSIYQEYDHANVHLDVLKVNSWIEVPIALEKQELYWQDLYGKCEKEPLLITTQKILDIVITKYGKSINVSI